MRLTTAHAAIVWQPEWVKKQRVLEAGMRYQGVGDWGEYAENAWSILIALDEPLDADCRGNATVTLCAHWAPASLFEKGIKFFVVEGPEQIAEVKILEDGKPSVA